MKFSHLPISTLIILLFFIPALSWSQGPCSYALVLNDTNGDGWGGSVVTVRVNGSPTNYTLLNGRSQTFQFSVTTGDQISVDYNGTSDQGEISYSLFDSERFPLFSDGPNPATGNVFQTTGSCPTCPRIDSLTVSLDDVDAVNIDVSWKVPPISGSYIIEYGPRGFSPGTGTFVNTNNRSANVRELAENTAYDLYLRVDCGADTSRVTGPFSFKTLFLNDVGIVDLLTPQTGCGLGIEDVEVVIKNFGERPKALIPFNYEVNGISGGVTMPQDGVWTGVLSNDSTTNTTFDAKFNFAIPGEYLVRIWTELENDGQITNDTFSKTIVHIPIISAYPYLFNFELWGGGWLPAAEGINSSWEYGFPEGQVIDRAASGQKAWVTNLDGDYNANELSFLVSPCLNFSSLRTDPLLSFSLNLNTDECCDEAWVELSVDGGVTWTKVGEAGTGINWYNDFDNDYWKGNGGFDGWVTAQNTLRGVAGVVDARLRLVFSSDFSNNLEGVGFDNVAIYPPLSTDLFGRRVTHFSTSDCGSPNDSITMVILNNGTDTQSGFTVSYQVNNETVVTETILNNPVAPSQELSYTFKGTFDSTEPGLYRVKAWANQLGDRNPFNDTTYLTFEILPPDPLPLIADFESGQLPSGWNSTSSELMPVGNEHNNNSFVLQSHLFDENIVYQVETNNIGPINPGDSLTFDYRFVNWPDGTTATTLAGNNRLLVQISTDCGSTYNTVRIIDASNHAPTVDMTRVKVDLDEFADQDIRIGFVATWGEGDYWVDIDNVNIIGCPPDLNIQFLKQSETVAGSSDGQLVAQPGQGQGPYNFIWNTEATTDTISELSAGNFSVTVTDLNGCVDEASVALSVCPATLGISVSTIPESSTGKNDGQATLMPQGGEAPYRYEWSNGATGPTQRNLRAATYTVTVTDNTGCSEEVPVKIDLNTSSYSIPELNTISIAPNPVRETALLSLDFERRVDLNIQLLNLMGQQLYTTEDFNVQSGQYTFDLLNYPPGLYLVRIRVDEHIHTEKLIKLRR